MVAAMHHAHLHVAIEAEIEVCRELGAWQRILCLSRKGFGAGDGKTGLTVLHHMRLT